MGLGRVYLVGAGPGDPGLITVRGRECLAEADLVLYDGLVNPWLLQYSRAASERTCRVDRDGERLLDQAEINRRLIEGAKAGHTVVRLKGGDPFVFGRGSEEARALAEAGIPFEVVPGITAAVAASAYAGISLTHREHASAVAFITGHEDPTKPETKLDYHSLARFSGTLVFYMGLHRIEAILRALQEAGMPASTPAAVISRGTTPEQRTVVSTVAQLPAEVARLKFRPPSLIVVGSCVTQRELIAWYEHRPLFGLKIGIPRAAGQVDEVAGRVFRLGGRPIAMPVIDIRPPDDWSAVDRALDRLAEYDWLVFTSANGVRAVCDRLWARGFDMRRLSQCQVAAIGEGTANVLAEYSLRADLVPSVFRAEELAAALVPHVPGKRVLWAKASRGRDVLPTMLREAGAMLDEVVVYQNLDVDRWSADVVEKLDAGEIDWIGLSSPSIARNIARLLSPSAREQLGTRLRLASISPVTTAAAREVGLPVHAEARAYTWPGLLDAISEQTGPAGSAPGS